MFLQNVQSQLGTSKPNPRKAIKVSVGGFGQNTKDFFRQSEVKLSYQSGGGVGGRGVKPNKTAVREVWISLGNKAIGISNKELTEFQTYAHVTMFLSKYPTIFKGLPTKTK